MNIIDKCLSAGFNVKDENGVVTFLMNKETYFNKQAFIKEGRKIRKFLKENGYNGSYGFKPEMQAKDNNN